MSKVLVVTGASRGIGRATAISAAEKGYAVCINYRKDSDKSNDVVSVITTNGGKAIAVPADVSKEEEVIKLFKIVDEKLGPITALVNNAGVVPQRYRADEIPYEDMEIVLLTNAGGTMLCCKEALKRMLPKYGGQGGAIVNVSSMSSILGAAHYWVHYGASKGAIDAYTIGLAKELAAEGIRVNAVRPGLIDTEMHARSGQPDRVSKIASHQPMKRAAKPKEVASGILWLLSDEASYVSGEIMNISGAL